MDVRMFTVGQIAENTYVFRRDGSDEAWWPRATVEAMKAVPEVNSRWHDDALEAEDLPHGLRVVLGW